MKKIVQIENLSKKYVIHHESRGAYATLVETLTKKAKKAFTSWPFFHKGRKICAYEELWPLKDINLDIEEGDRIALIGKNGAGKSTLLKILSRITEPTFGKITIAGRVSSLLEVGTGFHPELTGKENIFLNGAILGMQYQEIKRKFDEIVAFSEVEKFLDTPVKHFSSGMYTRLGFAIAAHLDPDLLILDEVLAVGDMQFQQKCLKKLNELSTHGRTVLFVSHDLSSVMSLCNKGIFLEKGILKEYGPIATCVNAYMKQLEQQRLSWEGNEGDEYIRFYKVHMEGNTPGREYFEQNEQAKINIEYEILKPHPNLILGITVWNPRNQLLACAHLSPFLNENYYLPGRKTTRFTFATNMFHEGNYQLKIECGIAKKKILTDQISLKLPIYGQAALPSLSLSYAKEGLFLGNNWEVLNEPGLS